MINASYNGHDYSNVSTLVATDGTNSATVTLSESGVIPTPTLTKSITANGTGIDVTAYAAVDVAVPTSGITPTGTKNITENGTYDVTNFASASVLVPSSGGITPTGTKEISITQNGTITEDVTNYASAEITVNVSSSGGGGISVSDVAQGNFPARLEIPRLNIVNRSYCFAINNTIESVWFLPDETGGTSLFRSCTKLMTFVAPNLLVLTAADCFNGCTALRAVDLPSVFHSGLTTRAFSGCTVFDTLVLRPTNQVITIGNLNVFENSPFASGGSGGTVYIPKVMYDHLNDGTNLDYMASTNWATLVNAGSVTFAKIEGSAYETAYVDGTPIT